MISAIARREILGHYASLNSWVALAISQLLLAWLLFTQLEVYLKILPQLVSSNSPLGITDLVITPTLSSAALILLIMAPLLGMGSFADELRSGRMTLLLSTPVTATQLVLGKWLGLVLNIFPLILLPVIMVGILGMGAQLDFGRLLTSFLGLGLFAIMAAAISLWLSSLNEQPLTAAAASWGLLFMLWLFDNNKGGVMQLLSLKGHLSIFLQGLADTQSLAYFLGITIATLGLTIHRIWRLGGGE